METGNAKERLRLLLKTKKDSLTPRELQVAGDAAARFITQSGEWKQSKSVCLYASFNAELPTDTLMSMALQEGKRLVLPRVSGPSQLELHTVGDLKTLQISDLGIRQPPKDAPKVTLQELGLILLPGLGFDGAGRRLGYGGGFYDRLLAKPPRNAFLLGHAHSFQLVSRLPDEPHDVRVHAVVTPQGWFRCRR